MSFIFYIRGFTWENLDSDMPTRRITDIAKVVETSAVSFPAYDGTDINARDQQALESAKATQRKLQDQAVSQAKMADRMVRDYPYQALGVAVGLGLLVGILAGRR